MSSVTDQAIERPSKVEVPRPTSSRRINDLEVAERRICATSIISTMKVERPRRMSSLAPTLVKTRSTNPSFALFVGVNEPACARIAVSAAQRK